MTRDVWDISVDVAAPSDMNRTEVGDLLVKLIALGINAHREKYGHIGNVSIQVGYTQFICEEGA